MNNLMTFENENFGAVRVVEIDGAPWFVGKDVAKALGYSNTSKAVIVHVDDDDKMSVMVGIGADSHFGNAPSGSTKTTFINESGLYSLILSSKLESAKKFKHWITSEVLPSIRRNGGYIAGQEELSDEDLLAKALLVAMNKIKEKDQTIAEQTKTIEEQEPLVIFANQVTDTENAIDMNDMSKLLCKKGFNIGRNRLFKMLKDWGVLMENNVPYQRFIDNKYFTVIEGTRTTNHGRLSFLKTLITGKGQIWLVNKLCGENAKKINLV